MYNVPPIVANELATSEKIIHQLNGTFSLPSGKSLVGEHKLFVTSQGNVIGFDSGGFLGSPTAIKFGVSATKKITVFPVYGDIRLEFNDDQFKFTSRVNEDLFFDELITVFKSDNVKYIVDAVVKFNDVEDVTAFISLNEHEINITVNPLEDSGDGQPISIPYKQCKASLMDEYTIILAGSFYKGDEKLHSISLRFFEKHRLIELHDKIKNSDNVFDYVSSSANIHVGKLYGLFEGETWDGQSVVIAKQKNTIELILESPLTKIGEFSLSSYDVYSHNKLIIFNNRNEIFSLEFQYEEEMSKYKLNEKKENIDIIAIQEMTKQPFFVFHKGSTIQLLQRKNGPAHFELVDVDDVSIRPHHDKDSMFLTVDITTKDKNVCFLVQKMNISTFIYRTYKSTKELLLPHLSNEQLFFSWARQVNDYVLYEYFSQLFAIESGIYEILERPLTSENEKYYQIANLLFHGLKAQRKRLDIVSIYLPTVFERMDESTLQSFGQAFEPTTYSALQQKLMGITNQVNRSIHEIEQNLAYVSFAIHPELDIRGKQKHQQYLLSGALGVGAITALPVLIIPAGIIALNTHFQSKVNQEMDTKKLALYVDEAIQCFEHMMRVMVPFFVSESNQTLFQVFKQVEISYQPVIMQDQLKDEFLKRISTFYTYKQMPIDDSTTITRSFIIEKIHETQNQANQQLNELKLRIGEE